MTIITVISQQPLTTEQVNSFKSVPSGGLDGQVLTKASDTSFDLVWEDAGGSSSSTNLSVANKTGTTFDVLSSTGTDATLPAASITEAGLLAATDKVKLNNLGTASPLDVAASGNAASGEVVKGNDTRLTDSRTPTSHTHTVGELVSIPTASLVGRYTSGTGVGETLSLGANLAASGGVLNVVGISGATNLTTSGSTTTVTINSDTGTDATIPAATASAAGVATAAQITKLDGIATGATANSSDATLLARANHTGTQLASTISDFNTTADARVVAGITSKEDTITAGTTSQYWRGDKSFQTLDKTAVGLGNVDNTSDANKPISIAGMAANSTGVKTGGVLTIGTPNTTFSISDGTGTVTVNHTGSPTYTPVSWSGKTNITATYVASGLVSYVAIDASGTVIQQLLPFTQTQSRSLILLGSLVHVNLTNLDAVNNFQGVILSPANMVQDLSHSIGIFNVSGNVFSANGANLSLNKSVGKVYAVGSNWAVNVLDPSNVVLGSLVALTFQYRFQNGANGTTGTVINPNIYDLAGVSTNVPTNKFTIQRIYSFVSNNVKIQTGQTIYNSLAEAKAAIQTEVFVTETSIANNGLLRGVLIVQEGTTSLTTATNAFFLEAPKFGGTAGVGGLSVSTMQNTYDNSSSPEILTDATRGALTLRRGSAADTDNVIEGKNGAGTTTFSITGNGVATAASYNNKLSAFNVTTSAELAGVISDETGTGSLVFGTSPNITTPTGIVKGDVGLGNVDNTSDATKNAASAALTNKTISGASNTLSNIAQSSVTSLVSDLAAKQASDTKLTSISGLSNVTTGLVKLTAGVASLDSNTYLTGNQTITVTGDISGSGTTAITLNLGSNVVTNSKLAQVATATFKGRITASTGNVEDLTAAQATSLLDTFTSGAKGLVGASGGGTTNFLRADGTWAAPSGGGSVTSGTSTVSFGGTETNETQFVVTGQTGIGAGAKVIASIGDTATSDYTANDHRYLGAIGVSVTTGAVIAGTGFTIYVRSYQKIKGDISINWIY